MRKALFAAAAAFAVADARKRIRRVTKRQCRKLPRHRRRRYLASDAAFSQEQLDIPQAEAEHMVQPDTCG
jgi:hypothetical protein